MELNEYGEIAYTQWLKLAERFANFELDVFQIMPNQMHGIIVLNNPAMAIIEKNIAGASLAGAPNAEKNIAGTPLAGAPIGGKGAGAGPARTAGAAKLGRCCGGI